MKKIKFLENPKEEVNLEEKMFPQMFELEGNHLTSVKGGMKAMQLVDDCDAVCLPSEWGGTCNCLNNLC